MRAPTPEPRLPEAWSGDGWLDISRPLSRETPVWPDDRIFELGQRSDGDIMVSAFSTTCHVGTHVDAPLHLGPSGIAVHEIPMGRLIGPAEVVRLPASCSVAVPGDLPLGWSPRYPKVLLRTDSHPVNAPIRDGFTGLAAELIGWLADRGVLTIGIDTPSLDRFSSVDLEAHHAAADRGLTWIEGLRLDGVEAGRYLFIGLPMPLYGTEAAPVRALVKRLES
jgi:arylformamidase